MNISGYKFEDPIPLANFSKLEDKSGVYVILGFDSKDDCHVVDVGESAEIKTRIDGHDRENCWKKQNYKSLKIAVHYVSESERMKIEAEIRKKFNPPCGEK